MSLISGALQQGARSHLIALLRKETIDLRSAQNELRWLGEHVRKLYPDEKNISQQYQDKQSAHLLKLCDRRSKGEPLQHILGSQPFGGLDIECRRSVLIPRPETEAYTTYLSSKICNGLLEKHFDTLIKRAEAQPIPEGRTQYIPKIRILDACSGSGCISLLLYKLLLPHIKPFGFLSIKGVDASDKALKLANDNLERNITAGHLDPAAASGVSFIKRDVLTAAGLRRGSIARKSPTLCHIIVSNPPYISESEYESGIPRSVRDWEPKNALVPRIKWLSTIEDINPADVFYLALIKQYQATREAFMLVMEIGDGLQAKRVLKMAKQYGLHEINDVSVWRDAPDVRPSEEDFLVEEMSIPTEGQGNVRAVVFVRHLVSMREQEQNSVLGADQES